MKLGFLRSLETAMLYLLRFLFLASLTFSSSWITHAFGTSLRNLRSSAYSGSSSLMTIFLSSCCSWRTSFWIRVVVVENPWIRRRTSTGSGARIVPVGDTGAAKAEWGGAEASSAGREQPSKHCGSRPFPKMTRKWRGIVRASKEWYEGRGRAELARGEKGTGMLSSFFFKKKGLRSSLGQLKRILLLRRIEIVLNYEQLNNAPTCCS